MELLYCTISVILVFICGNPAAEYLFRDSEREDMKFYLSFPLGFALLSAVLNFIAGCNLPLRIPIYIVFLFFFVIFLWSCRYQWSQKKIKQYIMLCIPLLFIIVVSCIAYAVIGSDYFLGNRYLDTLFYIENPEALIYFPLHTEVDQIANNPWLMLPTILNPHRISITVVHAFLTVLLRTHCINTLGSTFVLPLVFIFCAVQLVFRAENKKIRILGLAACLLPSVTNLYLEGFLGATYSIPFTLLSLSFFDCLMKEKKPSLMIITALFISTAITVYTDTFFIIAGLLCLDFLLYVGRGKITKQDVFHILAIFVILLCLNIFYLKSIFYYELITRDAVIKANDLNSVYDNIHGGSFFAQLFFGSLSSHIAVLLGITLYFSAFFGFVLHWFHKKENLDVLLFCFIAAPWIFVGYDAVNVYLFYRITVISVPALCIGIYYFYLALQQQIIKEITRHPYILLRFLDGFACIFFALFVYGSIERQINCIQQGDRVFVLSDEAKQNFDELRTLSGKNIYYVSYPSKETYFNFYYGRNNSFWLNDRSLNKHFERGSWFNVEKAEAYERADYLYSYHKISTIPENIEIMYDHRYHIDFADEDLKKEIALTLKSGEDVVVPGSDEKLYSNFFIDVYSKTETDIEVTLTFMKREEQPTSIYFLDVYADKEIENKNGNTITVTMHLKKGMNSIYLRGREAYYIQEVKV